MTTSSSASLPRNAGTPLKSRKQSAPATTDLSSFEVREEDESSDGTDNLSKQSSGMTSQLNIVGTNGGPDSNGFMITTDFSSLIHTLLHQSPLYSSVVSTH